jgi:peptidoglycan/LPS O-acetylase OafA/YrhL
MRPSLTHHAQQGRLKELDGWRAVSVLLVIVHHIGSYQFGRIVAPHLRLALVLNDCGPLGVRVFFVISGFVICRLLILEEMRSGSVSLKGFYIRRVFRILPPFYFYLGPLCFLLLIGLINESMRGVLSSALFLYDFVPAKLGSWFVGHTWSLAVEEQFYLTFPTLWVFTRNFGRSRAFLGIFCLLVTWNLSASIFGWNQFTNPNTRTGFACICCGVVLASLEARARAVARAVPAFAVAMIAFSLLWHPAEYYGWKSALYDSVYMPLSIALVLIFSLERGGQLREFLCWKPIQAVGLTSYGIYLWQELFTAPSKFYSVSGKPISYLLPLLFVIVPLSYLFIEKPAMRLGRSLAERVRQDPLCDTTIVRSLP